MTPAAEPCPGHAGRAGLQNFGLLALCTILSRRVRSGIRLSLPRGVKRQLAQKGRL
jgi:hypothetical protein